MKKQEVTYPELLCGACFALCYLAFMLIEAFINERCAVILGSDAVNTVYTFGLVFTGLGFFSFSLLCKICKEERSRKTVLLIICTLFIVAASVLQIADKQVVFLVSAASALLLTGHTGGYVYYSAAMHFAGSRYMGRMIGIGMGAAVFLQFTIQNLILYSVAFVASVFLYITFVVFYIIKVSGDSGKENLHISFPNSLTGRKAAAVLVAAVVLMSLVAGMIDSVLTAFNAEKTYDIYSGVRLFYAVGLILAGFIADIDKRRYLPLATVCAMLLSSVSMFFLAEESSYFAGVALMYLYSGFYVMFFTVMFLDFAPKSGFPELWAGMGRIVRSFTVAATVLPTLKIYDALGSTVLAVGSCLFSIGIMLVLLPHISRTVKVSEQGKGICGRYEISPHERLKLYAEQCSLTPRETEVLEMLLTTDDDLQSIADSLYISRRMVQRHISSIYKKTETRTRLGLFQRYMDFTIN